VRDHRLDQVSRIGAERQCESHHGIYAGLEPAFVSPELCRVNAGAIGELLEREPALTAEIAETRGKIGH
jgi:hypothetical protein